MSMTTQQKADSYDELQEELKGVYTENELKNQTISILQFQAVEDSETIKTLQLRIKDFYGRVH